MTREFLVFIIEYYWLSDWTVDCCSLPGVQPGLAPSKLYLYLAGAGEEGGGREVATLLTERLVTVHCSVTVLQCHSVTVLHHNILGTGSE